MQLVTGADTGITARAVYPVPVSANVGVRLDPAVTVKAGDVPNGDSPLQSNLTVPEEPMTTAVALAVSVLHSAVANTPVVAGKFWLNWSKLMGALVVQVMVNVGRPVLGTLVKSAQ